MTRENQIYMVIRIFQEVEVHPFYVSISRLRLRYAAPDVDDSIGIRVAKTLPAAP